mmetsp:Transcript_17691/g.25832  ORF Transcript_17691/g.25832 Transcript_17691/m.25832 type:complete len:202 (-) Transcript_17691:215-820(-)
MEGDLSIPMILEIPVEVAAVGCISCKNLVLGPLLPQRLLKGLGQEVVAVGLVARHCPHLGRLVQLKVPPVFDGEVLGLVGAVEAQGKVGHGVVGGGPPHQGIGPALSHLPGDGPGLGALEPAGHGRLCLLANDHRAIGLLLGHASERGQLRRVGGEVSGANVGEVLHHPGSHFFLVFCKCFFHSCPNLSFFFFLTQFWRIL